MADSQFLTLRDAASADISERNFIAIFAVLIRQLKLSANRAEKKPQEKSYLKKIEVFAKKPPPYSFDSRTAIEHMHDLRLELEPRVSGQVEAKIAYSVEPHTAFELLKKYFSCHFLHNPASRTASCLNSQNTTVQITPKGVALVQRFFEDVGLGLDQMPEVIKSNFNTMRLFVFRRSKATSRALYSEYFNHILTSEMFGPEPHVWSPSAKHEASTEMQTKKLQGVECGHVPALGIGSDQLVGRNHSLVVESPFYHRYFSNPESDCHIQYFESGSGVRVFHNRVLKDSKECKSYIPYSFSGKAFVQWLMDCSTLYSIGEAVAIGQILLRYGLVVQVSPRDSWDKFIPEREALYTLSSKATCQWDFCQDRLVKVPSHTWDGHSDSSLMCNAEDAGKTFDTDSSSRSEQSENSERDGSERERWERSEKSDNSEKERSEKSKVEHSLKAILLDPGLSFLFRKHLEKEQCAENLDAYTQIEEFHSQRQQSKDLIRIYKEDSDLRKQETVLKTARSLVRKKLFMASQLYGKYFSPNAPCNLNIGFDLQQQLDQVFESGTGHSVHEDLRDYMQTPVSEKHMFSDRDDVTATEKNELMKILEPLDNVNTVFRRITSSIYRLMETDSYVNFIRSDQYAQATQILGK